jgi:hypothetical protein
VVVFRAGNASFVRHPGFVRHQALAPLIAHRFVHRQFARTGFQNSFPVVWGNWGWPVGDWTPDGYAYQPIQQAQEAPLEPQVIVIHDESPGRMITAEATPDYSYVQGCRAIANGYHCDIPTATR